MKHADLVGNYSQIELMDLCGTIFSELTPSQLSAIVQGAFSRLSDQEVDDLINDYYEPGRASRQFYLNRAAGDFGVTIEVQAP